tara:strand:- start:8 stop:856 length:849 start_codon:yes stop_codon:yes gene_type:complete
LATSTKTHVLKNYFLILIILSGSLYSQSKTIEPSEIDSLIIESVISVYSITKSRAKGIKDSLVIKTNVSKNEYYYSNYTRTKFTYNSNTKEEKRRKKDLKIKLELDTELINELISQLDSFPNTEYEIDNHRLLELANKKRIFQLAKLYDIDWHFKKRFNSDEDIKSLYKSIQSLASFKIFIQNVFTDDYGYNPTDYSNFIKLNIFEKNNVRTIYGYYPNPVKQPWLLEPKELGKEPSAILNLDINKTLFEILPSDFLNRNSISESALIDKYIIWNFRQQKLL